MEIKLNSADKWREWASEAGFHSAEDAFAKILSPSLVKDPQFQFLASGDGEASGVAIAHARVRMNSAQAYDLFNRAHARGLTASIDLPTFFSDEATDVTLTLTDVHPKGEKGKPLSPVPYKVLRGMKGPASTTSADVALNVPDIPFAATPSSRT